MGNVSIKTNEKDRWSCWERREKAVYVIVSGDPRHPTTLFTFGRDENIISGKKPANQHLIILSVLALAGARGEQINHLIEEKVGKQFDPCL